MSSGFANSDSGEQFQQNNFSSNNVPGLGFDFPHLAAINGGREQQGNFSGDETPFGFSGFLLTPPAVIVESQQPVQEQLPAPDQSADAGVSAPAPLDASSTRPSQPSYPRESVEKLPPPAPQHDVPQYVFVRRDGGLVFAVAYSWENGTLRYVTPDGIRRSITRDVLDLEATQKFNEQRGLDFRLPA
jgi:hypothetical protein